MALRARPLSVAAVSVAVLAGGCGSSPSPERGSAVATRTAGATPTATPSAQQPAVDITRPRPRGRVGAVAAGHGRLRATITVQGFAAPGSRVTARSACAGGACRATDTADGNGMWRLRLRLTASTGHPLATISAASTVPGPPRRRVVRLHAVRTAQRAQGRSTPATTAPAPSGTPVPLATRSPVRVRRLVLIGDSLGEGIEGLLPSLLPGWTVRADALTGRSLAAGMQLIDQADLTSSPTVLAVSLFTNDDPRATAALAAAVRRTVGLVGPHGCAIWATIVRPPYMGVPYTAANATLRRLAVQYSGAMLLVPWAEEVARHPSWLAPDHVHATPAGYQARASMYASAALACRR